MSIESLKARLRAAKERKIKAERALRVARDEDRKAYNEIRAIEAAIYNERVSNNES